MFSIYTYSCTISKNSKLRCSILDDLRRNLRREFSAPDKICPQIASDSIELEQRRQAVGQMKRNLGGLVYRRVSSFPVTNL